MGNEPLKSSNQPTVPDTISQQNNLAKPSTRSQDQGESKSNPKHDSHLCKRGQLSKLNEFIKICDDFENALKTVQIHRRSKNSVNQKLLHIHEVLVSKMFTLEKFDGNKCYNTKKNRKNPSNLSSQNKSLSSSISNLHSTKSSKRLSNLPLSKEFLNEVNCPFCDKCQLNKYCLIKHLDENCLPFKMKSFKEEVNLPYSIFQILPNNYFKCNICPNIIAKDLQDYYNHFNCFSHRENLKTKGNSKSYSDSLFCSICKVLVPNNSTELIMHLEHQQHRKRSNKFVYEKIFLERKICCIYYRSEEYYCFVCSRKFVHRNNLHQFMEHLFRDEHKQNLKKYDINAAKAYCESCDKEIIMSEMYNHFLLPEHKSKILKEKCTRYALCVYCASDFSNLTELSNHMQSGCKEIVNLRKDSLTSDLEAASGKSTGTEKGVGGKPEVKDGHCLFIKVSDDPDASYWKNLFENFGHVISINKLTDNKLMIVFKERACVDKIIDFKDTISINSKILTMSESLSEVMESQPNQNESQCESDEENSTSDDDDSDEEFTDEEMKNLFQEVGSHLLKTTETTDSSENDEILLIAQMTLKGTVTFSGFRASQLFLPNETRLNLHCDSLNSLMAGLERNQCTIDVKNESIDYTASMLQRMLRLIHKSPFWEHAEEIPGPVGYVKCVHKRSGKSCIISFSGSDKALTDALRACVEGNDFIRPFLLTLKLWFSSQETFLSHAEYPIIAVILFFFTSKSLVRPFSVPELPIHLKILRALPDDRDLDATKPAKNIDERDISRLFQMFLEFLTTFDFRKYAVCFPISRPVPRSILTNILGFEDDSSICIMDTCCTRNYTPNVLETQSRSFLKLVNKTLQEI